MAEPPADRVQALFDQAVALPEFQRPAFLDTACAGQEELRAELESLLACDARFPDGDADEGPLQSPLVRVPPPEAPVRIGRYRVLRRIAEGGMGTVYEAEQDSPRRVVALKVVRPSLATPSILNRFSHEARFLARLRHPGIAHVYEAGIAADGRPFFAMEYIDGLPLDEYVRSRGLDLAARVEILAKVCDAVQHAHENGVIHRDLKPANLLVDQSGNPRVLDFGVARATDGGQLTGADLTQTGQLIGTLNYMSPEQVSADSSSVDERSDVYALGVILFELAANRLPYRLEQWPLAEAARLIQEHDPPRLGSIDTILRGDVETIVARALEKDPARRYQTPAALAADLRRWLAHEPILARPPSALYNWRKFARRHKALVGGVLATGAALTLGLVGTILFAVGEARERAQAERSAGEAIAEKREALSRAYRARLAAAAAALTEHDVAGAASQLDAAPRELRDWEWRHLKSRLDDSLSVARLPAEGSGAFITGPTSLHLGIPSKGGLQINDLDGVPVRTVPLPFDNPTVVSAVETRMGLRLAVRDDGTFSLFDGNGKHLIKLDVPGGTQPRIAFSPDGTKLAWPKNEKGWSRLRIGDAVAGRVTVVCEGHRENIWSFVFSPDGTRIATAGEDGTARVWDPTTGQLLATCRGHASKVLNVAFRPDGARLVTTSSDGTVRQWDAKTGEEVEPPYERHSGDVTAAAYSPDGLRIASASTDRSIRVWRAGGRRDEAVLLGHTGPVVGLAFAPDGLRLASVSSTSMLISAGDGTMRVWDVDPRTTFPVLRGHTSYVYPVAYSPDGRWIASGGWDSHLRLWDAASGTPCAIVPQAGVVRSLSFFPDSRRLVIGSDGENALRVWNLATARTVGTIPYPPGRGVRFVSVSPDGRHVAVTLTNADEVPSFQVSEAETGREVHSAPGAVLAYSPDGKRMACLDTDWRTVVIRDARTYQPIAQFKGHDKAVRSGSFSPDGRRIATSSLDRTIRVWNIADGSSQVLRGHTDDVFAVAFHPSGARLASAGRDRGIWIWDLARGEEVLQLPGHTSYVWSLAFSPNGETLASGSGDFTVRLWDTAPPRESQDRRRLSAALRPEADKIVESLRRQNPDPNAVADEIQADTTLSAPLRQAALRSLLETNLPPEHRPDRQK